MLQEFAALRYQLVEAIESSKLILQRSNNEIGVLCESVRSLDLQQALAATRSQCLMLETQQQALAIKVEGLIKQADQQASPAPVPKPPRPSSSGQQAGSSCTRQAHDRLPRRLLPRRLLGRGQ